MYNVLTLTLNGGIWNWVSYFFVGSGGRRQRTPDIWYFNIHNKVNITQHLLNLNVQYIGV